MSDAVLNRTKQEYHSGVGLAQAVAAHSLGVSLDAVAIGDRGDPDAMRARQLAMYLSRAALKLRFRDIARAFRRSHPTVLYACRRIEAAREDPGFDRTVEWLEAWLRRAAGVPS